VSVQAVEVAYAVRRLKRCSEVSRAGIVDYYSPTAIAPIGSSPVRKGANRTILHDIGDVIRKLLHGTDTYVFKLSLEKNVLCESMSIGYGICNTVVMHPLAAACVADKVGVVAFHFNVVDQNPCRRMMPHQMIFVVLGFAYSEFFTMYRPCLRGYLFQK
jgi:hypothetical protein